MDGAREGPIFRDIRRYYCEFCGIYRSKKALITSHMLADHPDHIKGKAPESEAEKSNTCEDCGVSFRKPAHLKQHMQSHSLERPFSCPVSDCKTSYRRKDHLNRHLLLHEGKLFACPIENCTHNFATQGNVKRHVKLFHGGRSEPIKPKAPKQHVCQEPNCGRAFKYLSRLQKHEDSHVKLDSVESMCLEPGCLKYFSNVQCLKAHVRSAHQHVTCEACGTKQLRKNIKQHLRAHEAGSGERIKCEHKGCFRTFSKKSNLRQHLRAVHLHQRPFACRISGCDMRFSFRHVRDNHEKSVRHAYEMGDFVELDVQFRSRPRGGVKGKRPPIETLLRKRVVPPSHWGEDAPDFFFGQFPSRADPIPVG